MHSKYESGRSAEERMKGAGQLAQIWVDMYPGRTKN